MIEFSPDATVVARGLGKRYRIGFGRGAGALYDRFARILPSYRERAAEQPHIWALRDVSFELPRGAVVGVIGRNGAGKSTLMRVLARVTAPTLGVAATRGRVGALLQVGAGFHPELTGRENIALSGAILGMTRHDVAQMQQSIVDFADLGRFLDAPVKHYSSGMYMRLAFAVSSHLSADVLLVDEALSVGDAVFQERSQQRIRAITAAGGTVVFVSHAMESLRELCDMALVLEKGELVFNGGVEDAIDYFHNQVLPS